MRTINQQIQDIMLFNYCKIQVDILLTLFIINFDTRKARVLLRFQRVNDNLRSMGGDQFFRFCFSMQIFYPFRQYRHL